VQIWGIIKEDRDEEGKLISHSQEGTIEWHEGMPISYEYSSFEALGICRRVVDAFSKFQGKVITDDWGEAIRNWLLDNDSTPLRPDGRIFWIPPQRKAEMLAFEKLLLEGGVSLVVLEVATPQAIEVVKESASESLDSSLESLIQEVGSFDGTQRPSTYEKRLQEYQKLKERAILYRDALGIGVEKAIQALESLESKVEALFNIRKDVTLKQEKKDPPSFLRGKTPYFEVASENGFRTFRPDPRQDLSSLSTHMEGLRFLSLLGSPLPFGGIEVAFNEDYSICIKGLNDATSQYAALLKEAGLEVPTN